MITPPISSNGRKISLSPRWPGGEGRVRGADGDALPLPTSPSHRYAPGPSLSPLKGCAR
jgi:hypothetical protein